MGGGGGGGLLGNFGTDVQASILKPTPIIYLAFEKKNQPIQRKLKFIFTIN